VSSNNIRQNGTNAACGSSSHDLDDGLKGDN